MPKSVEWVFGACRPCLKRMLSQFTADVFGAFILGATGLVGGGILFEGGKRYVKTAGSNQFRGKVEAAPYLFGVIMFGWGLEYFEPVVEEAVWSIPALARFGVMVVGSMGLLNFTIDNFTYTDEKSLVIYGLGMLLIALPYL